jgi:hypothetical protein
MRRYEEVRGPALTAFLGLAMLLHFARHFAGGVQKWHFAGAITLIMPVVPRLWIWGSPVRAGKARTGRKDRRCRGPPSREDRITMTNGSVLLPPPELGFAHFGLGCEAEVAARG